MKKFLSLVLLGTLLLCACDSIDGTTNSSVTDTTDSSVTETTSSSVTDTTASSTDEPTVTSSFSGSDTAETTSSNSDVQEIPTDFALVMDTDAYPVGTKSIRFILRNYKNTYFKGDGTFKLEVLQGNTWTEIPFTPADAGEDHYFHIHYSVSPQLLKGYNEWLMSIRFHNYEFDFTAGIYRVTKNIGGETLIKEFTLY